MGVISGGHKTIRDIQLGNIVFTDAGWKEAGDDTHVVTLLDRSGGGFSFATDATDNDCSTFVYGGEAFDFGDVGCRGVMHAQIAWNPAGADTGDMFIGFSDTLAETFFADADTIVSGDHIGFWVATGSAFWRTLAQNAAADSGETTTTACVDATIYNLRIEWEGLTGGLTIRYYVDEVLVDTVTGFSYTSFGPELQLGVAVANKGGNANVVELYDLTVSHRANS